MCEKTVMSYMGRSGWAELSTVDHERGRQQGRQRAEKTRRVSRRHTAPVTLWGELSPSCIPDPLAFREPFTSIIRGPLGFLLRLLLGQSELRMLTADLTMCKSLRIYVDAAEPHHLYLDFALLMD
jgi:hypothetical protein